MVGYYQNQHIQSLVKNIDPENNENSVQMPENAKKELPEKKIIKNLKRLHKKEK